MRLPEFALERYFARYEFEVPYLLSSSDIEGYRMEELLALADEECRELWRDLSLGYTESAGHPLLRREISALYESVAPEETLVFSGAEEAIFAFMNVVLGPGDHAVVTWPSYQSLHEVARAAGAQITLLPLRHETGWRLDPEQLEAALRPQTKAIIINAPHNPTGASMDRSTLEAVVELARDRGAYLFSDEVYRLLEHDPANRLPPAADLYERAVSLGVMSKAFALAGLRVGWVASRDAELLQRLGRFKDYTTICNSAPSEVLALIALRARERVLERSLGIISENLPHVDGFFERWAEKLDWVRPTAGCIGFPRLNAPGSVEDLAQELAAEHGTMLLPGSTYAPDETTLSQHFRLGFGRRDFPQALERLEDLLWRRL